MSRKFSVAGWQSDVGEMIAMAQGLGGAEEHRVMVVPL